MSFHPSVMVFLSVGFGGMAVAGLLTVVQEKVDAALTSRRTRRRLCKLRQDRVPDQSNAAVIQSK